MDDYVLQLKKIGKVFPGVKALDEMDFSLKRGEIHALIGENGAGKSTLMKVLSGVYTPDEGEIILDNSSVKFKNTIDAEAKGISIVHQELTIFNTSSVAENIVTVNAPRNAIGLISYKKLYRYVRELLDLYGFQDVDEKRMMRSLSVGRQQIVEILRAVSRKSKILILDEPTSALTEKETEVLIKIMRTLNADGVSIIYISHRLEEIFEVCDSVTVMRDGKFIKQLVVKETTKDELVSLMVGRDVVYQYGAGTSEIRDVLLEVKNLSYHNAVKDVSLTLHRGEVLGLAGLEGAGRTELMECLFGVRKPEKGKIFLDGKQVRIHSPVDARNLGIGYMTKDRKSKGLFIRMSICDNIAAANIDRFTKRGIMQFKAAKVNSNEFVKLFQIKTPNVNKKVMQLSGGNQQKVLMSMWISRNPKILLIDEPTRGIDVGTKESIHSLIRDRAKEGMGIIIISSDMPELIGASDRIIAMYEGKITGELSLDEINENRIMQYTSGIDA